MVSRLVAVYPMPPFGQRMITESSEREKECRMAALGSRVCIRFRPTRSTLSDSATNMSFGLQLKFTHCFGYSLIFG